MTGKKVKPFTEEEIRHLKYLYEQEGLSYSEIGEKLGISESRIGYIFKKKKLKTRKYTISKKYVDAVKLKRTVMDADLLRKLYLEDNLSIRKIARKLNVPITFVRNQLIYHKIPLRPHEIFTTSKLTEKLLRSLYIEKNLTAPEIADRLGCSNGNIRKRLHQFKIKKRTPQTDIPVESQATNSSDWLTAKDVAERYKAQPHSVSSWVRKGLLPNARFIIEGKRRYWLIPSTDLENFQPRRSGNPTDNPSFYTIIKRGHKAEKKIREIYGNGKKEIFEIIELAKAGWSNEEIAVRYQVEERIIKHILEKAAVKPHRIKKEPSKRVLKRVPKDLLIELYVEKELTLNYILERLETNLASLYINLRYYGIPLRTDRFRLAAAEMEQALRRMFLKEKKNPAEIAATLGLSEDYIKRKLRELKISKSK